MFTYHNNTLCINASALYDELKIMTESNYKVLCSRKILNKLVVGGNGRTAKVSYESIPERFKSKILSLVGDPYKKVKHFQFSDYIVTDLEAEKFFRKYELTDGTPLPEEKQREYLMNVNILNACHTIRTNVNAKRKAMGGSKIKGIWDTFSQIISELPTHTYPHTLPTNTRSLTNKYRKFKKEGYESLIHGNFLNKNSEKLIEEAKWWVLSRYSAQVNRIANMAQLHKEYNQKASEEGWKPLKEEKTLYNFLHSEEIQPLWYGHRYGELAYKEKYTYQFSTKLPSMRDSLWYSDGTKLNYYYQEEGKMKTCQVYEVLDTYSEVLLGYHISPTENYEAQFNAFRMATQVSGHRPFQIGMDNQGGHKKLESGNFLTKIARLRISTQPYNGKSKTIENAFKRLQEQYLKQDWFFTGMNITTKKRESKANMEFILANVENLPTLKEVKEIYAQRRKEWNAAPHPKTGKPRLEMYLSSTNPDTPKIELADMIDLFWVTRPDTVKFSAYGLQFQENKQKHVYMKYREDGSPDLEWLELNIDKSFTIKYDPSDKSLIYLYEDTPLGLRFVTEMTPKIVVNRGIQEQEKWEASYIDKIINENKEQRIARRDATDKIQLEYNQHPTQQNLNAPTLKGIEKKKRKASPKKRTKKVTETDIAEHLKELSNLDNTGNENYYNEY